jgi:hypothetical protein
MTHLFKRLALYVLGIFFLAACNKHIAETDQEKLPRRKLQDLVFTLDSISDFKPNLFYTKISTKFSDTNREISFKTSIRMVQDSAINAMITYASLPIVNSMITKDSVVIVNKKDKCYIRQSLDYIKENFAVDFSFTNIEELILGLPVDFDSAQKYFMVHDPYNYVISSHKKREMRRNERLAKDDLIIQYVLTDDAKGLKGMYIESPSDSASIKVDYIAREIVGGFDLPKEVYIQIKSPRNNMRIFMDYEKTEVNERRELILIIPENYEECK